MFKKLEAMVFAFLARRQQARQQKNQMNKMSQEKQEFLKHFQALLEFTNWLNLKGFANRAVRKDFWSKVSKGETILEDTIRKMMDRYESDYKEKKK